MEITANAVQEVTVGNNVIFTDTAVSGNPAILHREGSGLVKLRGLTSCQCRARFKVFFSGNIAVAEGETVGPIALAITIDGEPVASTTMVVTPAAVGDFFNVASAVYLNVPADCCSTVGVRNTGEDDVTIEVQNANLIVERVA